MLIGTVPHRGGRLRLGFLGSCRLHDPVKAAMAEHGGAFDWSSHNAFTHSPAEALQHLRFCLGQIEVPDPFAPYILRQERTPLIEPKLAELAADCDVLVVEVSSFEELRCGGYLFNSDYFAHNFVRGKGVPLLEWFRGVGEQAPPGAERTEAALAAAGTPAGPARREILHTLRKAEASDDAVRAVLGQLAGRTKRLILMPIFNVPGGAEALVARRAAIAQRLAATAAAMRFDYIDPSPIVADAGAAAALDGQGADIFHYAPPFLPKVGRFLLGQIIALATAREAAGVSMA